jgi:curved DNA-binding protein CbpA
MTPPILKDYYRTLELQTTAKTEDVKKAYRRLAMKYHPDTNNSDYAVAHFREIKEAYETLSDADKRRKYDEERWLIGMGNRAKDQVVVTPAWIQREAKKLSNHMATIDTYRMSHSALHDYVFLLLSDTHMAVLLQTNDSEMNKSIVTELLKSVKGLKYEYKYLVGQRLSELVSSDNTMLNQIYEQVEQSRKTHVWEKNLPLLVFIISLILCVLMFFYSRK